MNILGRSAVAGSASRLVIVDLVTLIARCVTVAVADSPPGPSAAETLTDAFVAAATLPGPGPLPALVPLALLKAHRGAATLEDAIDQCVTQSMAAAGTPGAAVAVALGGELSLFLWDAHSGWTASFTLEHAGYGIFLADLDEDGELDSDFELIERGSAERAGWLRNRSVVGVRRSTPRPAGGSLTPWRQPLRDTPRDA